MKSRYQILTSVKNWYQIIICEEMAPKLTRVKNLYLILTHVNNLYQIIKHMRNWYVIVSYVIDKTVKNWNRMQNAAYLWVGGGGGEHFINVRNTRVCYIQFDFLRVFHKV